MLIVAKPLNLENEEDYQVSELNEERFSDIRA